MHWLIIAGCAFLALVICCAGILWILGAVAEDEEWRLDDLERKSGLRDNE